MASACGAAPANLAKLTASRRASSGAEQVRRRPPTGLFLEIDISECPGRYSRTMSCLLVQAHTKAPIQPMTVQPS